MKKDKTKSIVVKSLLGCACLATTLGATICNVSSLHTKASDGASSGVRTVASYFTATDDVTVSTNVDTPAYVKEKRNGVWVESDEGGTVTYENLIDVTNLTKDDLLFEVQWTPETVGEYEFEQLLVRWEDSVNPKNYIEVSLLRYPFYSSGDNTGKYGTVVTVKTSTIADYKAWRASVPWSLESKDGENPYLTQSSASVKSGSDQGCVVYGSFLGQGNGISNSVCLYYDDTEHAIYTKNISGWPTGDSQNDIWKREAYAEKGKVDKNGKALVLDLDDPTCMGTQKSNLWTGFPSGKAKMTVKTSNLVADSANYMLLTLDEQTFDGTLINDTTAPDLFVDTQGYAEDALPKAQVGKTYPLFSATATDKMYGDLDVTKHVYKNGEEIFFTGDGFIPSEAGDYTVDYVVYDGSRNKTVQSFTVTAAADLTGVQAKLTEDEDAFPLWDNSQKNENGIFQTDLYYPVVLPEAEGTSDSGKVSVTKQVTYDGNPISVNENTFYPQWAGEYVVTYTFIDYIGNMKTLDYVIEATYTETPLLKTPVLPDYIAVGKAYKFPAVESQLYTPWQQKIQTQDKITLYKADGTTVLATFTGREDAAYTPVAGDVGKIVVEYSTAADAKSAPVTYRKEVVVVAFDNVKDLFVASDGVTATATTSDIQFAFTDEAQKVTFVHPVFVYDGMSLTFNVPQAANNFSAVQFVLRDKLNADNVLVVKVTKPALTDPDDAPTSSYISVNGGKNVELQGGSFYGNTKSDFYFRVTTDGSIYDNDNNLLLKDENFAGFTSGYAYVEFSATGIDGDATVAMKTINNQKTRDNNKDRTKPILYVFNEPSGFVKLNEKVTVSGAAASDVFDGNAKLTVTITYKDNKLYRSTDAFGSFAGCTFQPTDYGTYVVKYLAEDTSGYQIEKSYNITVRDSIAPVLQMQGNMPTTGTLNQALNLPTVVALDNVDWNLQVYVIVINPMNTYTLLRVGEEYVPTYTGRHIVKYYCEDKNYNTVYSEDYVIDVQ